MKDEDKTRDELINELAEMRQRITELEASETEHRRVEEALRESEEKYRNLVQSAVDVIYTMDTNGNIISVNKALKTLFGFEPQEVIGRNFAEFAAKEALSQAKADFEQIVAGKKVTTESVMIDKDGKVHDVECNSTLIIKDGKIVGSQGIVRDITERKRMEEALKESEERLRSLFETMAEGVVLIARDGQIVEANSAAERILGLKRSEIEGRNYVGSEWKMLRVDGTPMPPEEMAGPRAMKEKHPVNNVVMGVKRPDAYVRWISVSAAPLINATGEPDGVVGTFSDITERKRAEEQMTHLNTILRAVRSVNQLITRKKDRHGLLQGACDNLTETRGYYHAWIALMDDSGRVVASAEAALDKKFLPMLEQLKCGQLTNCARRALRAPDVVAIEDPSSNCGDCPLKERYYDRGVMTVRLESPWGKIHGLLCVSLPTNMAKNKEEQSLFQEVARDIAFALYNIELEEERKRMEEALRESEEKYRSLYESSKDGIVSCDMQGNFLDANGAFLDMLGYTIEEVKKLSYQQVTPKKWHETEEDIIKNQVMARGYSDQYEKEYIKKDGTIFPITIRAWLTKDERGDPTGTWATVRDITERKKTEERIREYAEELAVRNRQLKVETEKAKEADRLKSEFLANMSHEIRTPLTAIKGAAYLLDKSCLSSEQKKLCSIIDQSGEQLLQIINNILDLARIEAGEVGLEEKEFSLKETLKRIIPGFELKAREKGLKLDLIYPSDLSLKILSDEGKLIQIVSNLISNALKFTERGKLELRVKRLAHSKIQILVKDTGIGIPKEKLSMIFNKFEQVNGTIRRKYEGTGLGLTIVKELVKILGGKIEVTSELGKGSTFSFNFPYRLPKRQIVPHKKQAKLKPKIRDKVKKDISILIAEDDDFGYYIIERFLEGYTITRAKDGKDALEKIKKKSYDLVLMDIQMPKMDGLEATRKIREKDSNLPIIALTAKAMKADEEKCLEAGCNDYISKPIAPDELIAKIDQYSAKRRLGKY